MATYPRNMVTHKNILLLTLSLTLGNSTGLSAENIAGRVLLILPEIIALLVWALLVAGLVCTCCDDHGNLLLVQLTIDDLLFPVW